MDTKYVTAGKPKVTGAVFVGPTTATLPTSPSTDLTGFTELGHVSEDGLTNSNSMENTEIKDWGGTTVLNVQTGKSDTFKFKLLEVLNPEVLKVVYGTDNVNVDTLTGITTLKANAKDAGQHAYVFDMLLRGGAIKRIVIPCASITEVGDIVYVGNDATGYEITLGATPDSAGNTHYEYIYGVTGATGATGATS